VWYEKTFGTPVMTAPSKALENRRKKLKFRAWHRGIKEMDLILGKYADENLAQMSTAEMDQFSTLLKQADDELYKWVSGASDVPEEFNNDIMKTLKSFQMIPRDFTTID
jgi:antitoxin CptB